MLQILCSSLRVKLLARAKLIFLGEQPDDFFSVGNPVMSIRPIYVVHYMFRVSHNTCYHGYGYTTIVMLWVQ